MSATRSCRPTWLVLLLLLTPPLHGQSTKGEILGNVTDASGAVVPGVEVTATAVETGLHRIALTRSDGAYTFPYLEPGR